MADAWIHVGLARADVFNDPKVRGLMDRHGPGLQGH
jgi:hypothetical protein